MSLTVLGGALLQWPIGRLSDRYPRPLVLLWITGLAALVSLAMSLLPAAAPLWVAAFLWGGLSFSTYSIAVTHMIDRLAPEDVLAGSSGMLVLNGLGEAMSEFLPDADVMDAKVIGEALQQAVAKPSGDDGSPSFAELIETGKLPITEKAE